MRNMPQNTRVCERQQQHSVPTKHRNKQPWVPQPFQQLSRLTIAGVVTGAVHEDGTSNHTVPEWSGAVDK